MPATVSSIKQGSSRNLEDSEAVFSSAISFINSIFTIFYVIQISNILSIWVPAFSYPYFDSPRLDLTVFGLRPIKSKTIRQKNLKKIKFYHVGLVNILLNSYKAEKLTIS